MDEVVAYYTKPSRWEPTLPWVVDTRHRAEVALTAAIRDTAIDLPNVEILDVGTGTGGYLHMLVGLGAIPSHCHGVDLVPERIEHGHVVCPGVDLRVATADDLPYDNDTFDLVAQFGCLSNISDPTQAASEMRRVLRPSGRVVWFDLIRTNPGAIATGIPDPDPLFPGMRCIWRKRLLHLWPEWFGRWTIISAAIERLPGPKQFMLAIYETTGA